MLPRNLFLLTTPYGEEQGNKATQECEGEERAVIGTFKKVNSVNISVGTTIPNRADHRTTGEIILSLNTAARGKGQHHPP